MSQGIYIVANDKVIDNAIALLNSIRIYDPEIPIYLIPYNEKYQEALSILQEKHQVQIFPNLNLVEEFTNQVGKIFPSDFLSYPNRLRVFLTWFGPLDDFIYIDTDIIVFESLAPVLDYFAQGYEFINCDFHYKGNKLAHVFQETVREQGIFTDEELLDVFNGGFWASKKGLFSESELYNLFSECAANKEYFDFSQKGTAQPLLNYIILKKTTKRLNLVKIIPNEPGSWGGSSHFVDREHILYDGDRKLRYLHWAGTPMRPGGPYRETWEYYRYLGETKPPQVDEIPSSENPFVSKLKRGLKKIFK